MSDPRQSFSLPAKSKEKRFLSREMTPRRIALHARSNKKRYFLRAMTSGRLTAARFADALAARGRYHFTTEEVVTALGGSLVSARAASLPARRYRAVVSSRRCLHRAQVDAGGEHVREPGVPQRVRSDLGEAGAALGRRHEYAHRRLRGRASEPRPDQQPVLGARASGRALRCELGERPPRPGRERHDARGVGLRRLDDHPRADAHARSLDPQHPEICAARRVGDLQAEDLSRRSTSCTCAGSAGPASATPPVARTRRP